MKILIVTQSVDLQDPILGFFHEWLLEFSKQVESVEVICLRKGEYHLPSNVHVHSLGKERGAQATWRYSLLFMYKIFALRNCYDVVFVHMNSEYVVLGGIPWRVMGKHISLWYTHGTVPVALRIASVLADVLFTASENSLRLKTRKKRIMGHGIHDEKFPLTTPPEGPLRFISVGRIARVKNIDFLIDVFATVYKEHPEATFILLGGPATEEDELYVKKLRAQINALHLSNAVLIESANNDRVSKELARAHVFLHASATGSLDKAPLEALLSGVPVITTNKEIAHITPHAYLAQLELADFHNVLKEVVEKRVWQDVQKRQASRQTLVKNYSLPVLIEKIVGVLQP